MNTPENHRAVSRLVEEYTAQVTLIEGNSGDRVQRVTHTLSPSTFYGGVHPP